ncbi:MAG: TolC family protein [Gemmatimonadetes bacterium]|nr:TolC family protein [Gemmatimonadota bacterium]
MRQRIAGWLVAPALLLAIVGPGPLLAQAPADSVTPLTLEAALVEARHANARLPVANLQVQGALARARQAHGALYPMLSVDGDVHGGAPVAYASSDAFLGVVMRAPLYQGGELRAARDQTEAEAQALQAGYRMAVRDVDYAVRTDYDLVLRTQDGLAFSERALERLRTYLTVVQSRQASGEGVGADLLQTQQRVATAEADIASLTRELHSASMDLNDALGRAPDAPLRLAPLPEPTAPADTTGQPWLATPDLARTQSDIQAAQAGVRAAQAGRKLHLDLEADAGGQPVLNNTDALLNNGTGWGTEVTLSFSFPFWDHGIYRGRVAEAGAALDQAHEQDVVVRRAARLAWTRAASALQDLYGEYEARDRAAAVARDAYLQAESVYRGGQGTALAVLDAYDAWAQAAQNRLDVVYNYRVAEADLYRWGNS